MPQYLTRCWDVPFRVPTSVCLLCFAFPFIFNYGSSSSFPVTEALIIRIDTFLRVAVFGRHKTNNGFRTVRASRCLYSNTCKAIKQPIVKNTRPRPYQSERALVLNDQWTTPIINGPAVTNCRKQEIETLHAFQFSN